ncbi:hypothetical protein EX30DRAFT_337517 [Ascodesmis nigricans]|uniref:DUF6973 domain-containing protein n=1 Tax=Ascodesmis nigricans TaxID=341454 RepID=A0A4S2N6Z6_9PEZI|nr:hypothetical protein EX30DRAFT_337517 [Ascodesmis nigricans]
MKLSSLATIATLSIISGTTGAPNPTTLQARQEVSTTSWYRVNVLEFRWCRTPLTNLRKCFAALNDKTAAERDSSENCPGWSLDLGWGDAFRHCYWSGRMVISLNYNDAKTIGDLHEQGDSANTPGPMEMDLANNAIGLQCGVNATASAAEDKYAVVRKCCWDLASAWPPNLKVLKVTQYSPTRKTPCSGRECLQ